MITFQSACSELLSALMSEGAHTRDAALLLIKDLVSVCQKGELALEVRVAETGFGRKMTVYSQAQLDERMSYLNGLNVGDTVRIQYTVTQREEAKGEIGEKREAGGVRDTADDGRARPPKRKK